MISEEVKKTRALETSVKEGSAANASVSFGDNYITPAILALNGNAAHVGIMQALVGLISPISQLFGSKLIEKTSRKKIVLSCASFQVLFWIMIASMPFVAYYTSKNSFSLYAIMVLYCLVTVAGGLLHPSWFSWMGSLVKEKERGKYFSRRSAIVGFVGLTVVILSSIMLDSFKNAQLLLVGFGVLFMLAAFFRIISDIYIARQYEPKELVKEKNEISWKKYLSSKEKIGRFAIGMAAFNFALMIASPFFAVYLLEERGMSYLIYTIVIMSGAGWNLLFLPIIGRISDKYGNSLLLKIAGVLFAISPPLWIFLSSPWAIIFIPQLLNGLANAALAIGFTNYTYSVSTPEKRGSAVAHINALSGVGVLLGSLMGGIILQYWRAEASIFLVVFLLAAICRGLVAIMFLSKIKSENKTEVPSLKFDIVHPVRTLNHDLHSIKHLVAK